MADKITQMMRKAEWEREVRNLKKRVETLRGTGAKVLLSINRPKRYTSRDIRYIASLQRPQLLKGVTSKQVKVKTVITDTTHLTKTNKPLSTFETRQVYKEAKARYNFLKEVKDIYGEEMVKRIGTDKSINTIEDVEKIQLKIENEKYLRRLEYEALEQLNEDRARIREDFGEEALQQFDEDTDLHSYNDYVNAREEYENNRAQLEEERAIVYEQLGEEGLQLFDNSDYTTALEFLQSDTVHEKYYSDLDEPQEQVLYFTDRITGNQYAITDPRIYDAETGAIEARYIPVIGAPMSSENYEEFIIEALKDRFNYDKAEESTYIQDKIDSWLERYSARQIQQAFEQAFSNDNIDITIADLYSEQADEIVPKKLAIIESYLPQSGIDREEALREYGEFMDSTESYEPPN